MKRTPIIAVIALLLIPLLWAIGGLALDRSSPRNAPMTAPSSTVTSRSRPTIQLAPPKVATKTAQAPDGSCLFFVNVYTTNESSGNACIVEWIGIQKSPGAPYNPLCVENGCKLVTRIGPENAATTTDLNYEVLILPGNSAWYAKAKPVGKTWLTVANEQVADGHFTSLDIDLQVHPISELMKK